MNKNRGIRIEKQAICLILLPDHHNRLRLLSPSITSQSSKHCCLLVTIMAQWMAKSGLSEDMSMLLLINVWVTYHGRFRGVVNYSEVRPSGSWLLAQARCPKSIPKASRPSNRGPKHSINDHSSHIAKKCKLYGHISKHIICKVWLRYRIPWSTMNSQVVSWWQGEIASIPNIQVPLTKHPTKNLFSTRWLIQKIPI